MEGHFDQELWGLAINNSKNEFFTGGQDKLLMKWDMLKRKCVSKSKLDSPISCIDLGPNNVLAVGMKNGIINFYDANTLTFISTVSAHKHPDKEMISIIKFSQDGNKVAVGYCPPYSKVYVWDFNNLSAKPKVCKNTTSRVNSIDFSRSGQEIMLNNTSYEILFYDSGNGSQITSATKFK